MSFNAGVLNAGVTLDDSDYIRKLSTLEDNSESTFKKIAGYAAAYLSLRAIVGFAQSSIKTFSDLEEETNKFNVVFQGMGEQTTQILRQMREEFGLSELAAKKMLAGTGDILTGFGFDRQTALDLSEGAAKLGADIASFSNYSGGAEGATNALTKAMLGETESAKLLGVVIRQDDEAYKSLIEQAMTTGVQIEALGKTFKVSTEQQAKAVAALALAYQQSPNAIGDFVRSQDSISNQTRILKNNFEQLLTTVGSEQASAYAQGLVAVNGLIKAYNDLSPVTRNVINNLLLASAAAVALKKFNVVTLLSAKNLKILTTRAKAAAASMGLVGAAATGIAVGLTIYSAGVTKLNGILEENAKAVKDSVDSSKAATEQAEKEADAEYTLSNRLQYLQGQQKLTNQQQEEADKIIKQLTEKYGKLGFSIDENTGKLNVEAEAWDKLAEKQKKHLKSKKIDETIAAQGAAQSAYAGAMYSTGNIFSNSAALRFIANSTGKPIWEILNGDSGLYSNSAIDTSYQRELRRIENLNDAEKELVELKKLHGDAVAAADHEEAAAIKEVIKAVEEQLKAKKALADFDATNSEEAAEKRHRAEVAKVSQKIHHDNEKKLRFDNGDDESKFLYLLREEKRIRSEIGIGQESTFQILRSSHLYTVDQIKALEQINALERQRLDIKHSSAKYSAQERKDVETFLADRQRRLDERDIERTISRLQNLGGDSAVIDFMQKQLDQADKASIEASQKYLAARKKAERDGIVTEKERVRVSELRSEWERKLSDYDRWKDRVDTEREKQQQNNSDAIGSFSAELIKYQIAAIKPEVEIAKNSRAILQEIRSGKTSGSTQTYGA